MVHSTELFTIEEDPFFMADLQQMARAHNYRRWQFAMVAPHVKGRILEVGGGIGNFTPELAKAGSSVVSIEPNAFCFKQLAEKTRPLTNVAVYNATVEDLEKHVPAADRFDTIIMMNVLEHIKDDEAVLNLLKKRLSNEGLLVILVPAAQWAFGSTDQRLGHYRRYSKSYSRSLIGRLNMRMVAMRYYNFIGLWAWWFNAKITRRENQNDGQIHLFDKYFVPVISRLEAILAPPVGQSILFVARNNPS
jgi:SAM-dependent methyltransferase